MGLGIRVRVGVVVVGVSKLEHSSMIALEFEMSRALEIESSKNESIQVPDGESIRVLKLWRSGLEIR